MSKVMQDSLPLRYSVVDGGEFVAKLTWRVIAFCTRFEGRPFWIIPCSLVVEGMARLHGSGLAPPQVVVAQVVVEVLHEP